MGTGRRSGQARPDGSDRGPVGELGAALLLGGRGGLPLLLARALLRGLLRLGAWLTHLMLLHDLPH